jgi:hypothetical protein
MSRAVEEELVHVLADLLLVVATNASSEVQPTGGGHDEREDSR